MLCMGICCAYLLQYIYIYIYIYICMFFGRQQRKNIDLYLKPFRGNNNIIKLNTSYIYSYIYI